MLRDVTIGQYQDVDSPIHDLDVRVKLMGTLAFIVALFVSRGPLMLGAAFVSLLALYRLAGISLRFMARGLRGIMVLLVLTVVFRAMYVPGTTILSWGFLHLTREGLAEGAFLASRIALMVMAASLLSYVATPKDMADGLEHSFRPLERIGVPVREMSVITMIAFHFIPVLIEEVNRLMDAAAARGARFEDGTRLERMRNMTSLLTPMFLSAVQKSADMAMAMQARGYRETGPVSKMNPLAYDGRDRAAYLVIALYLVFFVAARILLAAS